MAVTIMRAPVQATGWPRLQPLPLTLVISCGIPSTRVDATHIDAKASLISKSAISSIDRPARFSAFGMAYVGPMPVSSGGSPADAHDFTIASGSRPCSFA
jgi:hypothetical protein